MNVILTVIIVLIIIFIVYILLLRGRTGKMENTQLTGRRFAHRGLHDKPVIPENSLAAFIRAKENGYGAEFDVHLMADGNLAVIHDSSLKRTADEDRYIEDMTISELADTRLEGTDERIPTFKEVLDVFNGEFPLVIELKCERKNHAKLCEAVCKELDNYDGPYCIESFDPRCVAWLRANRPDIVRGQLVQNFVKEHEGLSIGVRIVLTSLIYNVAARPDFIACKFEDRKMLSNIICCKLWHIKPVAWTIRTQNDMDTAEKEGIMPIYEKFIPDR